MSAGTGGPPAHGRNAGTMFGRPTSYRRMYCRGRRPGPRHSVRPARDQPRLGSFPRRGRFPRRPKIGMHRPGRLLLFTSRVVARRHVDDPDLRDERFAVFTGESRSASHGHRTTVSRRLAPGASRRPVTTPEISTCAGKPASVGCSGPPPRGWLIPPGEWTRLAWATARMVAHWHMLVARGPMVFAPACPT
jgi:hypothetical protein